MFVIQNIVFVLSAVFLRIKKLFGRMVFAYERQSFVRANRRIDLSQKVVNIPDEFGGGCLYMDEGGKFFIVRHTNRLFNLKIEKLTKQQAIDYAWVRGFGTLIGIIKIATKNSFILKWREEILITSLAIVCFAKFTQKR